MPWTTRRRILVADDDETIATTFRTILTTEGYDVVTAGSGSEALALAEREPCDLVLLDLVMPEMDGLTALRHLAALDPPPAILVLAADVEAESEVQALEGGAAAVLLKPPDVRKLLQLVDELTSRKNH